MAEELETVGRGLLTEVQEDFQEETVELAERTTGRRRGGLDNWERRKRLV